LCYEIELLLNKYNDGVNQLNENVLCIVQLLLLIDQV
jgi:hypothetical protein